MTDKERAVGGGWVGSQAVNETGQRWMTAARTTLRLPAAGWMSEMVGRSKEFRIDITGSNHNFNTNDLHQWMLNAAGGSWPSDAQWKIVVHGGVQLVCHNSGAQTMWFGGAIRGKVIVENHGWIFGRGGNGSRSYQSNGNSGGHAIYREGHINLEIINHGIIAGGGGGGGSGRSKIPQNPSSYRTAHGGGGAPFGIGYTNNQQASITNPTGGDSGYGSESGGNGGGLGSGGGSGRGDSGSSYGGSAGYSIGGGGPLSLTVQGDLRGPVAW